MSYDIRFGVKVEGMGGYIAVIDEPDLSSPTYNLRDMFVACMGWDYNQGEWYNCAEVFPKILNGANELKLHPKKYTKYNSPNGWGTVDSALLTLESMLSCIKRNAPSTSESWNAIPLEFLWIRW